MAGAVMDRKPATNPSPNETMRAPIIGSHHSYQHSRRGPIIKRTPGEKSSCTSALQLPGSFFEQPLLELLLALNAMPRPGHSLKTLGIDFLATVDALAKAAFPNPRERSLHHLQQLPL